MTFSRFLLAALLAAAPVWALANYNIKDGNGNSQTIMSFVCQSVNICPAHVIIDSSGNEKATSSNPLVEALSHTGNNDSHTLWDGTNVVGVAPANTQATAAKPALVVALTPNGDPCQSNSTIKSSAKIGISSATTTQIVAISGSTAVYVCGWSVSMSVAAAGATSFQFEYGTGSNCGTGTTAITGTFGSGTAAAGFANFTAGGSAGTEFTAPSGNALCIVTAGTAPVPNLQGYVTYVQQ